MTMQPASTEIASRTAAIIQELKGLEGPLLPILHGIQEEFGHVPQDALPVIAEALNISKAEVHGVVTFYHDYRSHPAGRHVLKLCQAEACQSMGSDAIAAKLKQLLG
ncbi:NAD(P)H-dependent oxidoreductase subunit E, partial [Mesorhizobium sp.]